MHTNKSDTFLEHCWNNVGIIGIRCFLSAAPTHCFSSKISFHFFDSVCVTYGSQTESKKWKEMRSKVGWGGEVNYKNIFIYLRSKYGSKC